LDLNPFITPDAVVVYPSRGKLFFLTLGATGFVAGSVFIWKAGDLTNQVVAATAGAFFGVCLVIGVAKLIWHRPALIINSTGILENSSAFGGHFLHWSEIEGIYISSLRVSTFSRQRFLSILLKRPEEFLSRQSTLRAGLMNANVGLVGAPVNISASALPMTLEEIITIIQQKSPTIKTLSPP